MSVEEEKVLIDRMQNGGLDGAKEAFTTIYNRYNLRLTRFLSSLGLTSEEQKDVVQETWLRAWKKRDAYEHRGSPFGSWLIAIAKNVAREKWRIQYREKPIPEGFEPEDSRGWANDSISDIIQREDSSEIKRAIDEALSQAPVDFKRAFQARAVEGLSSKETAERHGWSISKVDTTFYRTLRFLRKCIIEAYGDNKVADWLGKCE